jgi:predicted N-formylglutamate amidohydrolase
LKEDWMLYDDEPSPFRVLQSEGKSPFFLTADHAGNRIPRVLGDLGLSDEERCRHIGWDIGIEGVTTCLSELLDATAVIQYYSRLVIDCNRQPSVSTSIPETAEMTPIPGNRNLDHAARTARREAIFDPYHKAIADQIAHRRQVGTPTIYVAMHSFTPVFKDERREMDIAVLYNRSPRLSKALASRLRDEGNLVVAENAPYRVSDETDYGVPIHAEHSGLDYVEIEIRQDLISNANAQAIWATRLARLLPEAANTLELA